MNPATRAATTHATTPPEPHTQPLRALWQAHGNPDPDAPQDRSGTCSHCGLFDTHASRVKAVVSDKFTGWDAYTNTTDPLWCQPCTWAHTTVELRVRPWHITPTSSTQPSRPELAALLASPLPHTTALTVPISRQKHILPSARWGHLTTDDRTLPWGTTEAARFAMLCALRADGFNETALQEPAPRFEQLITLSPEKMRLTLTHWERLEPWRADDTYLSVACIASRPSKEPTT